MNLKSVTKEIAELKGLLPPEPTPQDLEARRFLAALTPEEIDRAAEILIDAQNGQEPTPEEMAFLAELEAREPVDLPPIDRSRPACHICGLQPATERGNPPSRPICDSCFGGPDDS